MTHKIGTRVRKVRGISDLGRTGIFVPIPAEYEIYIQGSYDMAVLNDGAWTGINGRIGERGQISVDESVKWEPILDPGAAPAQETHEQLMTRLRAGVVENVDG